MFCDLPWLQLMLCCPKNTTPYTKLTQPPPGPYLTVLCGHPTIAAFHMAGLFVISTFLFHNHHASLSHAGITSLSHAGITSLSYVGVLPLQPFISPTCLLSPPFFSTEGATPGKFFSPSWPTVFKRGANPASTICLDTQQHQGHAKEDVHTVQVHRHEQNNFR
jgi:hypothetical protein